VLEADRQDGPDHVDSHRSALLVIPTYNRGGVIHRFANTTDVLATIEEILGLDKLYQFDFFGRPLREILNRKPDLAPYVALEPEQTLKELNPAIVPTAKASLEMNIDQVDAADEDAFNRILWSWSLIQDRQPYPGTKRTSSLEIVPAY
jgi:hypothetical protein